MKKTTLEAQSAWLEKRKAELGYSGNDFVAANPGERRTPEKRALLKRLEALRANNDKALDFSRKR
jgi:hypothetical protein